MKSSSRNLFTALALCLLLPLLAMAQPTYRYAVTVNVVPPVSPYLNQLISPVNSRLSIQVRTLVQQAGQVKIVGRLECLSPKPFIIALNPTYIPAIPVQVTPGVLTFLMGSQIEQTFGNLNENYLQFSGITLSALKEGINYKLPEGIYRLCLVAYDYNSQNTLPASDPNQGCATFSVCYKASAPQITQPVNGMITTASMPEVRPSSLVPFTWTPPQATCGAVSGIISYDLEIKELFPGQAVSDAVNNPYVFRKQGLPSTTFLLDTNLYRNVLYTGKRYIVRVRASNTNAGPSLIEIDNGGYSRPEAFQYGQLTSAPPLTSTPSSPASTGSVAGCGLPDVSNKSPITTSFTGTDVKIGGFTLRVENATKSGDAFSGNGYILWKPGVSISDNLKLSVDFSGLKINTDGVAYEGTASTTTNAEWQKLVDAKTVTQLADKLKVPAVAKALNDYVTTPVNQLAGWAGKTKVSMPLGLNSVVDGKNIALAITNIVFSPKGTNMSVVHSFQVTESSADAWLTLAGTDFCIKPDGFSFDKGTLFLPNDREVKLGFGGDEVSFTFKGAPGGAADLANGTSLSWTAAGIEMITANAELKLPRTLVVPQDGTGAPTSGEVTSKFKFTFQNWENWIAEGTILPFQLDAVKELGFSATTIYYDHSQKRNPDGISFPEAYTDSKGTDFTGLYIREMQVSLPPDFKTFSGKRPLFAANHLILNESGLTTSISGKNIIKLEEGSLGGWGFSLTDIGVTIASSTFKNGFVKGELMVPLSSTPLPYQGTLHTTTGDLGYEFIVQPKDEMKLDLFLATMKLHNSSVFEVKKDEKGTAIRTNLKGEVTVNTGGKNALAALLPGIAFDKLAMANRNPDTKADELYVNWGNWAFSSPAKSVGGMPVKISNIYPYATPASAKTLDLGLKFDIGVEIGYGDKTVISGATTLDIKGRVESVTSRPTPKFTSLKVDKVKVEGAVGPVSMKGLLQFYDQDKKFGDGLKGHVEADFKICKVDATAQFGKTLGSTGFNYWFIDARAAINPPISVVGPLSLAGFGGGAYYNMSFTSKPPTKEDLQKAGGNPEDITPGKTLSGLNFEPSRGAAGLRATIIAALTDPKAFNGDVTLTAEMDVVKGSFTKFGLEGNAYFVTNYPTNSSSLVTATIKGLYDIPNSIFDLGARVEGSFSSVKAIIPVAVYSDPSKWFVKVGDPFGERVQFNFLNMDKDPVHAHLNANAYLAAGNVLEGGLPPLPTEVTQMEGMPASSPELDQLVNEVNRTPGGGFMMGAQVRGDFRASFLFLYAQAKAILGFDLMLKHFNDPINCNGKPGGINDWYALGQLYAYLKADVGVHVDVWFYEGDLSLCSVEAGAVLRGGLPNPNWAEGNFAVKGEVLGGVVKVNTAFRFEMGEKCFPVSDPLSGIKIISDYGPQKSSVFDEPYGVANVPLDTDYEISVPPTKDKPAEIRHYRFSIRSFSLSANGQPVVDDGFYFSPDRQMVMRRHNNIFEPKKTYTATIVCYAQQYYPDRGIWGNPLNDKTGKQEEHVETTTFNFTTGTAPIEIPNENITLAYPVPGQRYLLKNEMGGQGRIDLKTWQSNLFTASMGMNYEVLYINFASRDTIRGTFQPNESSRSLAFKLPSNLEPNATYRVVFWPKPKEVSAFMGSNGVSSQVRVSENVRTLYASGSGSISVRNRVAQPAPQKVGDIPIYSFTVRTSQFNSLQEKLAALGNWNGRISGNKMTISNANGIVEPFDESDVKGFRSPNGTSYGPVLSVQLDWEQSKANDKFVADKVYANAFVLAFSGAHFNFASPEARKDIYKPVYTLDWKGMVSTPPIGKGEMISQQLATGKPGIAPVATAASSLHPGSMATGSTTTSTQAVNAFSLSSIPAHKVTWTREVLTQQDFELIKSFAAKVLDFQKTYAQLEKTISASALEDDDSPQLWTTNKIGGTVFVPMNKLYAIYGSNTNLNTLRALRGASYEALPRTGSRTLSFKYGIRNLPATTINKTLTF